MSVVLPDRKVILGPVIGRLGKSPIHEWIDWEGEGRWTFKEMAVHDPPGSGRVNLSQLKPGEAIFSPGAIYTMAPVEKAVESGDKSTGCGAGEGKPQI